MSLITRLKNTFRAKRDVQDSEKSHEHFYEVDSKGMKMNGAVFDVEKEQVVMGFTEHVRWQCTDCDGQMHNGFTPSEDRRSRNRKSAIVAVDVDNTTWMDGHMRGITLKSAKEMLGEEK